MLISPFSYLIFLCLCMSVHSYVQVCVYMCIHVGQKTTFSAFFFFFETNSLDCLEISSYPQGHTCLYLLGSTIIRKVHHASIFT